MIGQVTRIQPLPPSVAAQIKSSVGISSVDAAVIGLVKNALDADATKVSVSVDYARGCCTVEDNGYGIAPYEFSPIGGLARPYCGRHPFRLFNSMLTAISRYL